VLGAMNAPPACAGAVIRYTRTPHSGALSILLSRQHPSAAIFLIPYCGRLAVALLAFGGPQSMSHVGDVP